MASSVRTAPASRRSARSSAATTRQAPVRSRFSGKPVHAWTPKDALERGVAIMHQELQLVPELTVAENVFLGMEEARRGVLLGTEADRLAPIVAATGFDLPPAAKAADLSIADRQKIEVMRGARARRAGHRHGRAHILAHRGRDRTPARDHAQPARGRRHGRLRLALPRQYPRRLRPDHRTARRRPRAHRRLRRRKPRIPCVGDAGAGG